MSRAYPGLPMRSIAAGMAFALCIGLSVRAWAQDVAQFIPADALVVFKINNLQQVNQDAATLIREFGIAEQNPAAADPLAAFQAQSGISEGLNLAGNLAVYIANGDLEADQPPMVVLVPVSDYQAFLGNFATVEDAGGGISRVNMRAADDEGEMEDDHAGYVMQMGDYAAFSPMRELLKRPEQPIRFAGVTAEMLAERDIVAYANLAQLGPMLLERMQAEGGPEQAKAELARALQNNPQLARFQPVAEAVVDQMFEIARTLLTESSAGAFALDLSDVGIGFGSAAQFKPGSYLANLFGQMNATEDVPLSGLPDANYIAFGGTVDNRAMLQKLVDDMFGPVVARLREVEGGAKLAEFVELAFTQMTAVGDSRMGFLAPTGPLGNSAIIQQIQIQGGDAATLKQAQRRMIELQPEIVAELGGEDLEELGIELGSSYQEDARTVGGVSFDKVTMDMGDQQGMAGMIVPMLFGPEGPTTYLAEVNGKLLMVAGMRDQQITAAIEAVQAESAPLADDEGVEMVLEHLLDRRWGVFFVRPDEMVRSGVVLARQAGQNIPIQMPDNLPPAGFATGPAEDGIRAEAFVPKDLISAMIVAYLQAQQAMGGMDDDL